MRTRPTLFWLSLIAGWAWTLAAGGGGLWLLFTRGPWPPTNGWFALLSGLSACPLIAQSFRERSGTIARLQFLAALLFFAAGHFALLIWPH